MKLFKYLQIGFIVILTLLSCETITGEESKKDPASKQDPAAKQEPAQVDKNLEKFASVLGEQGEGGYKWPPSVQKVAFKTTKVSDHLESVVTITLSENVKEEVMALCVLIAGQTYGVATHQGIPIEKAAVVIEKPAGKGRFLLPLKECTEMGKALLAQPRDDNQLQNAIFNFTMAALSVRWTTE